MPRATKMRIVFYLLAVIEIMLVSAYYWSSMPLR
jgi:hypothetical protein